MLRFPAGMRDRLKDAAAANNRSLNAEIIARLEESFAPPATKEDEARVIAQAVIEEMIESGWTHPTMHKRNASKADK